MDKIQIILADLYKLDAGLIEYEEQIIRIINETMISRPDTKFDAAFASRLKTELMARAGQMQDLRTDKKTFSFPHLSFAGKFTYALVGAAVVLLVISLPLASYLSRYNQLTARNSSSKLVFDFKEGIEKIKANGFGRLSGGGLASNISGETGRQELAPFNSNLVQGRASAVAPNAAEMKLGVAESADSAISQSAPAIGMGGGGNITGQSEAAKIMPPYFPTTFDFVYKGDDINQTKARLPVYKRVKNGLAASNLGRQLSELNTRILDMSKFADAGVTYVNLTEDKEFGFMISLDFQNDTISISPNWQRWPRPDADCRDEACYQSFRVKPADVPPDSELIKISKNFLKNYGVNTDNYGEPFVLDFWRRDYEIAKDKSSVYIPDEMTVVYPLVINNETVYDESGNPTGVSVGVNIRQKKVSGVYGLAPQNFRSSEYEAVTDTEKIMEVARRGGLWGYYQYFDNVKKVSVELGTPKLGLVRYYHYNNETQISDELYIPAYVFPVVSVSDKEFYFDRKNVVVPLIQEIIKDMPIGVPEPQPLPLEESISDINLDDNEKSGSSAIMPQVLPGSNGVAMPEVGAER